MFNDPTGELAWFVPVIIGAVIGAGSAALQEGANFGSILTGGLIGGAAGLVGFGVGNLASGGSFFAGQAVSGFVQGFGVGFAGGAAGGFVGAAGSVWANGGSFTDGFGAGIKGALFGGIAAGVVTGITSGISAVKQGRNFWSGEINYSNHFRAKAQAIQKSINELRLSNNQDLGLDYYYDAIEGMELNNGYVLNKNNVHISLNPDATGNARYVGYKGFKHHVNFDIGSYEITRANIQATMVHEVYGHGIMGYTDALNSHYKAYFSTIDSQYWGATTLKFKQFTVNRMYEYFFRESGTSTLPNNYLKTFWQYQTLYNK